MELRVPSTEDKTHATLMADTPHVNTYSIGKCVVLFPFTFNQIHCLFCFIFVWVSLSTARFLSMVSSHTHPIIFSSSLSFSVIFIVVLYTPSLYE